MTSKFVKDDTIVWNTFKPLNNIRGIPPLTLVVETIALLILSSIDLLILPISDLDGLISLNDKYEGKLLFGF